MPNGWLSRALLGLASTVDVTDCVGADMVRMLVLPLIQSHSLPLSSPSFCPSPPSQVDDLPLLVAQLVRNERRWSQVQEEFPEFTGQESAK